MSENTRPLIPQYSIRWLLAVMTAGAVVFSIFGLAVRGKPWAMGVSIAIVSLGVLFLAHALFFGLVWLFSLLSPATGASRAGKSPFASAATSPLAGDDDKDTPAAPILLE